MAGTTEHVDLPIAGMTCASCASRVERRLNRLDGVAASVNYATEQAAVDFDPQAVRHEDLVEAVAAAGYQAVLPSDRQPAADEPAEAPLRRRLIVSAALALPVLLLSMVEPFQFDRWHWVALQLAAPVAVWGAWPFHRAAWQNLCHSSDEHTTGLQSRS